MRPFLFLVLLFLGACGTPPRERFFTLDAPEPPVAAADAPSITVGPVSVPDMVDRPQLVVRTGANEVSMAEQARWAEPLRSAIARVVGANLARELGLRMAPSARSGDADYRVALDVLRFESGPGDAVLVDAAWTVASAKGKRSSGRSVVHEKTASKSYDAVAAAHSAALAQLSKEIAEAIRAQK